MPYWRLFYHVTWAVKERMPLIDPAWEDRLHSVLAAKAIEMGSVVHAVGGTADHVHLALSIPPSVEVARVLGRVKGSSSHFVNHELEPKGPFAWQSSYGVLSFGEKALGTVVRYVHSQKQHHSLGNAIPALEKNSTDAVP